MRVLEGSWKLLDLPHQGQCSAGCNVTLDLTLAPKGAKAYHDQWWWCDPSELSRWWAAYKRIGNPLPV